MQNIELKLRKGIIIFFGIVGIGVFLFIILFLIYLKIFQNETLLPPIKLIYIVLCFFMVTLGIFFYYPNIRFNINKSGISATRKLKIWNFILSESNQHFEWDSIKSFKFKSWLGLFYGGYWCYNNKNDFILIRWRLINYRKAVEIIAETLSQMGTSKIDPKIIKKINQWKAQGLL